MHALASINLWAGEGEHLLLAAGYTNRQSLGVISEEEVAQVAMKIFAKGLNVMLCHSDSDVLIWVDTRRFSQR
jgi:hypothetical protein